MPTNETTFDKEKTNTKNCNLVDLFSLTEQEKK